ncbi:MAG: DUF484 family protein [Arenicellales bacterium WSBS_2016_MAG_OTU3]
MRPPNHQPADHQSADHQPADQQKQLSTNAGNEGDKGDQEHAIVQYLIDNPDTFTRHPEALEQLQVPTVNDTRVVSLVERQLEVLRNKLNTQQIELDLLLQTAERNSAVQQSLNDLVVELLAVSNTETALRTIPTLLNKYFNLAASVVQIPAAVAKPSAANSNTLSDSELATQIIQRISHGSSICDDCLPAATLTFLFAEKADVIGSCALLPITLLHNEQTLVGFVAMGAEDASQFHPAQGTHFLNTIARMISAALNRCLR